MRFLGGRGQAGREEIVQNAIFHGKRHDNKYLKVCLVDVSDIFYFFSARGRGRGSSRRQEEGGGSTFYKKSQEGGGSLGWVGAGGEGPGGCLRGIRGGG